MATITGSHRINDLESVFKTLCDTPYECPSYPSSGNICDGCSKLEELDKEIAETLSNLAKKRRALTAKINQNHDPYIHQLPSEIASQIFLFYKDINCQPPQKTANPFPYSDSLGSLLRVASVCKTWREIMFATPELWTVINIFAYAIPISLHTELAKQWLDRAGALPLSITIYCNRSSLSDETLSPNELDPLFEVLREHNAQWRELILYLPMDFYRCFQGNLTGAPILETFRLLPSEEYTTHFHQLLLPDTPRLVHLEISFPRLVDILGQWEGLTHFEAEAVSVEEILHLLRVAPQLVLCKAGGVNDMRAFGIPDEPITHSSLKELHFAPYHDLVALNTLFDKTLLPALEHFLYVAPLPLEFPMAALCSLFNRSRSPLTQFTFVGHPEIPGQLDDTKVIGLLETVPTITQLHIYEFQSLSGDDPSPPPLLSEHLIRWIVERDFEVFISDTDDPHTNITSIQKRSYTSQRGAERGLTTVLLDLLELPGC